MNAYRVVPPSPRTSRWRRLLRWIGRGQRFIGVAIAASSLASVAAAGCTDVPKPVTPDRWQDAGDTVEGAKRGTPCHRAALKVHELHCAFDRPDFEAFCNDMVAANVPLCPLKIAAAKTCKEADEACR